MHKVIFNNRKSEFYNSLKLEVFEYFDSQNIEKTGNAHLYFKTALLLFVSLFSYILLVFFTPSSFLICALFCSILGVSLAFIGFNVSHDACHGSYAKRNVVNHLFGYTFNIMGVNSYFWRTKHNVIHHTYTNIDGVDGDILQTSLLRLAPTQEKKFYHKYQHLYCVFIYSLSYVAWVFFNDFDKYFSTKKRHPTRPDLNFKEHVVFWISKVIYFTIFFFIPIYFVGIYSTLIGFLIMAIACGLLLGIVFQLAHIVENTEFEDASANDLYCPNEWAVHQFRTTANFATNNPLVTFFLGGLNFQVEHHLFSKISHIHYPNIQSIVRSVCQKHQVVYNENKSLYKAIVSHYKRMKYLGSV